MFLKTLSLSVLPTAFLALVVFLSGTSLRAEAEPPRKEEPKKVEPEKKAVPGGRQPLPDVEGLISGTDGDRLVCITIGSDVGIAKEHTLEVFRLDPNSRNSKLLGTMRVLDVRTNEAVGEMEKRVAGTIRVGDRVSTRKQPADKATKDQAPPAAPDAQQVQQQIERLEKEIEKAKEQVRQLRGQRQQQFRAGPQLFPGWQQQFPGHVQIAVQPFGRHEDARLGIRVGKPSDALADQLDLPKGQGLIIEHVRPESAAAKAGLKVNDILLEVTGKPVANDPRELGKLISDIKSNTPVEVVVARKGKKLTIKGVSLPATKAPIRGFPGRSASFTNITRTGDQITTRHQEGMQSITISGTIAEDKLKVSGIQVSGPDGYAKYDNVDKVPEKQRAKVKRLIELSEKVPGS